MVSLYVFEETPHLSTDYPVHALRVHAGAGCGKGFRDVAAILEPDGPNPCLVLYKPLGCNGVRQILDMLDRRTAGPTTGQIMRAERWDADLRRISESKKQVWGTVQFQKPVHGYKVGDTVEGILTADLEGWTVNLFDSSATRRQINGLKHDEVTFTF